jgi:hypothetical protein
MIDESSAGAKFARVKIAPGIPYGSTTARAPVPPLMKLAEDREQHDEHGAGRKAADHVEPGHGRKIPGKAGSEAPRSAGAAGCITRGLRHMIGAPR